VVRGGEEKSQRKRMKKVFALEEGILVSGGWCAADERRAGAEEKPQKWGKGLRKIGVASDVTGEGGEELPGGREGSWYGRAER